MSFGQEVVREMNRLRMLDVSHVSDETMSDVLDISKLRSSLRILPRALSATSRETSPTILLKRIAANGGVVHVNFYSAFVDTTVTPQSQARDRRLKAQQDAIDEKYKNDPERRAERATKQSKRIHCRRCRSRN